LISSYEIPKTIDNNAKNIIHKSLMWRYGNTVDNVFILSYDSENQYGVNGKIRYDLMVYKLDYEKSEFIPASDPFDFVEKTRWAYHSIPDGFKMIEIDEGQYTGGSANIEVLGDGYVLITYKKRFLINGYKDNTYNSMVLLKYNNGYWDIKYNFKFKTKEYLMIEQTHFDLNTKNKKYVVYNNDILIELDKNNNYKPLFKKGKNILIYE